MSDYGSDVDEATLETILSREESDYGSDLDEDAVPREDSDYGSDLDDSTVNSLLLSAATPIPRQKPLPVTSNPLPVTSNPLPVTPKPVPVTSKPMPVTSKPKPLTFMQRVVASKPLPVTSGTGRYLGPQTQSRLMQLPPEIRDQIYELLFEDCIVRVNVYKWSKPPGVLLTCKEIHCEAIGVYYRNATFRASYSKDGEVSTRRLQKLPWKYQNLIRRVALDTVTKYKVNNIPMPPAALAQVAEYDIEDAKLLLASSWWMKMQPTVVVSNSMKTPDGKLIWSDTPLKTYRDLEAAANAKKRG